MKMTLKILSLCVLLQLAAEVMPLLPYLLAFSAMSFPLCIFQTITHMFAHAGWGHLIGNFMFGLPFMVYLEHKIGHDKLLDVFVVSGLGSLFLHCILMGAGNGLIGSSGALSGVASCAVLMFGKTLVERRSAMIFAAFLFIHQFSYIVGAGIPEVAFWGHVGGLLTGAFLAMELRCQSMPKQKS